MQVQNVLVELYTAEQPDPEANNDPSDICTVLRFDPAPVVGPDEMQEVEADAVFPAKCTYNVAADATKQALASTSCDLTPLTAFALVRCAATLFDEKIRHMKIGSLIGACRTVPGTMMALKESFWTSWTEWRNVEAKTLHALNPDLQCTQDIKLEIAPN